MKLIQRLTLLSSLALLAGACDLQQTFDERIDDKQLLVLTPDFADTSVQLVFRDPETLAVLDQDFEVTVYSNKRLVDLNGNYKNQFVARGGVMEFSVSPEETVTESDPLEISISALSADGTKIVSYQDASLKRSGFISLPITPEMVPDESEFDFTQNTLAIGPKSENILSKEAEEPELKLLFNGQPMPSNERLLGQRFLLLPGMPVIWESSRGNRFITFEGNFILTFPSLQISELEQLHSQSKIVEPLQIKVDGPVSLIDYSLSVKYWDSPLEMTEIVSNQDGETRTKIFVARENSRLREFQWIIADISAQTVSPYSHSVEVPTGALIGYFELTVFNRESYASCPVGFNLKIEGLESGTGTSLLYKATRENDNEIFATASFTANSPSFTYNSLQDGGSQDKQYIYKGGNRLEFMENAQYIIEPQVIDLGGEEACGNTYTVQLKRRDNLKKHQLNLSMRNENQNVGLALTFSALLRKQGQDNTAWETVNFKQGSTSLLLEEGSTYEVKLTLADEPFEFTFTNDLSLVEAAVQATLRNVTRIKDINYSISESAEANTIDAEIVFYQGQSLID